DGISMRNLLNHPDVNSDGHVSSLDALMVINDLNANGSHSVSSSTASSSGPFLKAASVSSSSTFVTETSSPLLDVNGDGAVTPNDVNAIINVLNPTPPSVSITLGTTDTNGNVITTIPVGSDFKLTATVDDF